MRAVDADALIHELNNSHCPGAPYVDAGISIAIGKVCDAPTIEPEPCEDAVSRADVIKEISESVCDLEYNCDNRALCEVIKALPSVTPKRKTGRWLDNYQYGYKCSECGAYLEIDCGDVEMNYCSNCGVKMNGGEQE